MLGVDADSVVGLEAETDDGADEGLLAESVAGPADGLLAESVSGPADGLLAESVSGPADGLLADKVSGAAPNVSGWNARSVNTAVGTTVASSNSVVPPVKSPVPVGCTWSIPRTL